MALEVVDLEAVVLCTEHLGLESQLLVSTLSSNSPLLSAPQVTLLTYKLQGSSPRNLPLTSFCFKNMGLPLTFFCFRSMGVFKGNVKKKIQQLCKLLFLHRYLIYLFS